MRRLATEFGLSDVGLGKICKRFDIPRPPVGYWAKKEFGKSPPQTPLPRRTDLELQTISIESEPEVKRETAASDESVQHDSDIADLLRRAKELPPIEVSDSLRNPHYLINLTKACFRDSRPDPQNLICPHGQEGKRPLCLRVSKENKERALRYLDAVITAVEKLGGKVIVEEDRWRRSTNVYLAGENATSIRVRERYHQSKHKQTAKEAQSFWSPRYDYAPTGRLLVDSGPSMFGRNFCEDTETRRIEDQINDLLIRFIHSAATVRNERFKAAEESRRRQDREKERQQKLRLIQAEEAKVRLLCEQANCWQQSQLIRRYVAAVRSYVEQKSSIECGSELDRWLNWASQQADRMDPLIASPPSIIDEKAKYETQYA